MAKVKTPTAEEKAKDYFEKHPLCDELFGTSDRTLFIKKSHAKNHAETLDDDTITPFKRETKVKAEAEDPATPAGAAATQTEE